MGESADSKKGESFICTNRNASRNFHLMDRFEAGMVLKGTEVKSIRAGNVHINDAYADLQNGEVYLHSMHIGPYSHGNINNHEPLRRRKLLLHRTEIRKLIGSVVEKGFTLVPVKLFWMKGRVKVELALAKGKTKGDRREDIKRRTAEREMDIATKRSKSGRSR
jgi:SsrA-binding protein